MTTTRRSARKVQGISSMHGIDEILSLRTLTLTDEEKRKARATGPRAAAIIDRVEEFPREVLERLHGAVRSLRPVTSPHHP
jgi:signal transduction histidine kinase